jgi:2-dehydropantoate 2-reductase
MRIAVVGLGGVGGYICAMLSKTEHEVVGFARGEHLRMIQKEGLEIVEDLDSWKIEVDARELEDSSGHFDVVLFCVKSYDLVESYRKIATTLDKNSIIISFSNGINNGDTLRDISDSIVLDGCIYILSHIQSYATIRKKGKVFAAIFGGDEQSTQKLAKLFKEANLRYKIPDDIKTAIWKKYIFISAFATITSYYNNTIGYIYQYHKDEAEKLLEEIALFAKTKGVEISSEVQKALDTASKVPYDSSTSMYLDFKHNKRVELENLSGYVKMPLMQKMYKQLQKRSSL